MDDQDPPLSNPTPPPVPTTPPPQSQQHSASSSATSPRTLARIWHRISSSPSPSRSLDSYSDRTVTSTISSSQDTLLGGSGSSSTGLGLPRLMSSTANSTKGVGEPVVTRSMARGSTSGLDASPASSTNKAWGLRMQALYRTKFPSSSQEGKEDDFTVLDSAEVDQIESGYDWHTPGAYPVLDGEEGVMVDDEACFVDSLEGKVDFISSLPQEISLYILLHLDLKALITTSIISKQWRVLALDNLVWRDLFHQESHWRIRETPPNYPGSPTLKRAASSNIDVGQRLSSKRSTNAEDSPSGSRLGRRLTDMMSDLGSLSLAPSTSSSSHNRLSTRNASYDGSESPSRPRRTNSGGISPFPPLTPMTSQPSPSPVEQALSRTPSASGISSLSSSTILSPSRRTSSATLPPLGPVPSPSLANTPSAPLAMDWPRLYRDRFLLEKRWEKKNARTTMLRGHTDSVYCLQFDDWKVISGSRDRTIKVWDLRSGTCVKTLSGHAGSVLCLQYDDNVLVTGSSDSRVLVWDLVGEKKHSVKLSLVGHAMGVLDLSFDDKWIVSCSKDTTIRVWDKETGELYRILSGHRGPVNAVQLLNGKVVSASGDNLVKLWDIESGSVIRVFTGHERGLACVQYSPTGKLIASGSNDQSIKIWDADTGECIRTFKGHTDLVRSLAVDEVRKRLCSASYDRTVRYWDLETGECIHKFTMHTSLVFDVGFSASKILSSSHDQRIIILDFGSGLDVSKFL